MRLVHRVFMAECGLTDFGYGASGYRRSAFSPTIKEYVAEGDCYCTRVCHAICLMGLVSVHCDQATHLFVASIERSMVSAVL